MLSDRTLGKQNSLQMTQVFPLACIDDQMGFLGIR
jgi:hypothetical protein